MPARLIPLAGGPPIVIDKPIILVGRQPDCDAVLQTSTKISRKHCCLAHVNNRYLIRDLGSMNGVRVNGVRVNEHEMKAGDEVGIGDVYFVFRAEEALPRSAHPALSPQQQNGGTVNLDEAIPLTSSSSGSPHRPAGIRSVDMSMEFPVAIPDEDAVVPVGSEPGPKPLLGDDSDEIKLKD